MRRMNLRNRTSTLTGAVVALLVACALGMGIRQLWLEGIFHGPETPASRQPVESEAKVSTQAPPDLSEDDGQFLTWLEQEMDGAPAGEEAREAAAETEYDSGKSAGPTEQAEPAAAFQQGSPQSPGDWRSMWADLNLTEAEQARLREGWALAVARWQNMSEQERQAQGERMRASFERWQNMSEEERGQASRELRGRFEDWRQSGSTELPDMILD